MANGTKNLALYCDFENVALGVCDPEYIFASGFESPAP